MTLTPYITLQGLSKAYAIGKETVPIFHNLALTVYRAEFVAIMGPSGSGKSTLLNLLSGIDHPDDGQLTIDGERLDRMGKAARSTWRAHKTGIVFQFYNLLPMLSAAQNVELALLLKPFSRRERRERVAKTLEMVGLAGRERRYPASLSGGQQQRVGIARALVANPDLLLCDEPSGNLDRASANEILAILQFLSKTLDKTIVMVTHDPQAARNDPLDACAKEPFLQTAAHRAAFDVHQRRLCPLRPHGQFYR